MEVGKKYKHRRSDVIYECMYADEFGAVIRWKSTFTGCNQLTQTYLANESQTLYSEFKEPVVHKRWIYVHSTQGGIHFSTPKPSPDHNFGIKSWKLLAVFPIEYVENDDNSCKSTHPHDCGCRGCCT